MVETSMTSKSRTIPQKSESREDDDADISFKDLESRDIASAKNPNQTIIEYLLARVSVFRELVEVRDLVSCYLPFLYQRMRVLRSCHRI